MFKGNPCLYCHWYFYNQLDCTWRGSLSSLPVRIKKNTIFQSLFSNMSITKDWKAKIIPPFPTYFSFHLISPTHSTLSQGTGSYLHNLWFPGSTLPSQPGKQKVDKVSETGKGRPFKNRNSIVPVIPSQSTICFCHCSLSTRWCGLCSQEWRGREGPRVSPA